ncbi:SusD/RagB family nutrient-binding outer membrane lipoprotein, partial [Flavihumibacter sediminis]|nr:SusD/RagB family nutrient-binding outer membrane lipoprotein [Flavihumibacter sediminis]
MYKNGTVKNDHLTKIITQKFIAQNPWLPLETWSDHRRLGLPFFENPAVENPLVNMPDLTAANYTTSSVKFFPQRVRYPSSFANSNPKGYEQSV